MIIKVPGKMMLAGEWGILEPGNSCIVLPVNYYVTAREVVPEKATPDSPLTKQVKLLTYKFLEQQKIQPQEIYLKLDSSTMNVIDNTGQNIKLGLGSSAAVSVATCKEIFAHHHIDISTQQTQELIFKLACLAHFCAQGNIGSGFDVACASYAQPILYKSFNHAWLVQQITHPDFINNLSNIITTPWPILEIEPIALPNNLIICVGFVGESASTPELIARINNFKKQNPDYYKDICTRINTIVCKIIQTLRRINTKNTVRPEQSHFVAESNACPEQCRGGYERVKQDLLGLINQNRTILRELSQKSGANLETPALTRLIEIANKHGAAAKFSGAGGGDCGIALCFDQDVAKKIHSEWTRNNILPLQSITFS